MFTMYFQTKLHNSISIWLKVIALKMNGKQNFRSAFILFYSSPSYVCQSLSNARFKDSVLNGSVVFPTSNLMPV